MAHRRNQPAAGPDLRSLLAARMREAHASFGELRLLTDEAGQPVVVRRAGPSEWSRKADQLDGGEPVDVSGLELKRWLGDVDSQRRYRVHEDGSVTPIPWNTNTRRR